MFSFTVERSFNSNSALVVPLAITGTATLGVDYQLAGVDTVGSTTGSITLLANANTKEIEVIPIRSNRTTALTVILSLQTVTGVFLLDQNRNQVTTTIELPLPLVGVVFDDLPLVGVVFDNILPEISAQFSAQVEEGTGVNSTQAFSVTLLRTGSLSESLTVNISISGSAIYQEDWFFDSDNPPTFYGGLPTTMTFNAGNNDTSFLVYIVADSLQEVEEQVILTVLPGNGYTIGTSSSSSNSILDDDNPLQIYSIVATTPTSAAAPRESVATQLITGNDAFANAYEITSVPAIFEVDIAGFGTEAGESALSSSYGHTAWWTWTPSESGFASVDTRDSGFDTILGVYIGTSLGNLVNISYSDDDSNFSPASLVSFSFFAGNTYYIQAGGYASSSGLLQLSISNDVSRIVVGRNPAGNLAIREVSIAISGTAVEGVEYSWATEGNSQAWSIIGSSLKLEFLLNATQTTIYLIPNRTRTNAAATNLTLTLEPDSFSNPAPSPDDQATIIISPEAPLI